MNYTRKDIIKIPFIAGLSLLTRSILTKIFNFNIKKQKTPPIYTDEQEVFKKTLEDLATYLSNNDSKIDILLINEQSIEHFDFVFLMQKIKIHKAPIVVFHKNVNYYPKTIDIFKSDLEILHSFARRHEILIYHVNEWGWDPGLIQKLIKCGIGNYISKDLYLLFQVYLMPVHLCQHSYRIKYKEDSYEILQKNQGEC